MKKLLILLCTSSLLACHEPAPDKAPVVQASEDAHQHGKTNALALNDGAKWKSDENTNRNVAQLEDVVKNFNNGQPKLTADFMTVASELQGGLDQMIKECRMQGADHEALHQWLEPLLKDVAALKQSTTEKEASTLVRAISERLDIYHEYFE